LYPNAIYQDNNFCPPDLSSGAWGKKECLLEDFAALFIWFTEHHEVWWLRAMPAFPQLLFGMNKNALGWWANVAK
jgi:hypothetical protein